MRAYHKNPRTITTKQFDDLREWLSELGDLSPIVHNLETDEVISGNQRMRAFDINRCEIEITHEFDQPDDQGTVAWGFIEWDGAKYAYRAVRWTPERSEKANIVANRAGGMWDWDTLANEFEIEDLLEWGFSEIELQINSLADTAGDGDGSDGSGADGVEDIDQATQLREKWGVELGQVWRIGPHIVVCGDCADANVVRASLGRHRQWADVVITSPPYGVGKEYEAAGIEAWAATIAGMIEAVSEIASLLAINLGDVKVGPDHREVHTYGKLVDLCGAGGFPLIGTRIWSKGAAWAGQGPYWLSSYRAVDEYEYVGLFGECQYVDRIETDWRYRGIWDIASVSANRLHSAAFPVELPERLMLLLTDDGDLVLDPFLGSGTTLVACEQQGRVCAGIELDPRYVAVTLERLSEMGLDPQLEDDAAVAND